MAFRHFLIAPCECSLDVDRALSRIHGTRVLNEHTVAGGFDDPPVMLGSSRVKDLFAERLELRHRPGLVFTHHPAVADNIGSEDRR